MQKRVVFVPSSGVNIGMNFTKGFMRNGVARQMSVATTPG
jgi:hypothetical protein